MDLQQLKNKLSALLAIDSTLGMYEEMDAYLLQEAGRLGFPRRQLRKGGVLVELGGEGKPVIMVAHTDTVGLMVRSLLPDGSLEVTPVGGLPAFTCLHENVRIYAQNGTVYTGTVAKRNPSLHLMEPEERIEPLSYDSNVCVRIDASVESGEDVQQLGISCGDFIALDPRTVFTAQGFIKSRFLDDKLACACLLCMMESVASGELCLGRKVYLLFTAYEELGGSGACGIPQDVEDYLALDIGCVGDTTASQEQSLSIIVKDKSMPYHRGFTRELKELCVRYEIPYVLDMMLPRYGSDANAAIHAGYDVRWALAGPGVLETHGYERCHEDALWATYSFVCAVGENEA